MDVAVPGLLLHHAESHPAKSSYAQLILLNEADGLLFSPRMILGGGVWNPKLGISLENKAGNRSHGPAAWALPPSGTAPWTSHPGDRALPGTSSFTIMKDCSNATKWSALLQPCGLCTDGWMDGRGTISHASSRAAPCAQPYGCRELKIPSFN